MEEEGAANCRGVTIFLVQKSSVEEAAHVKKKKRTVEQADHVVGARGATEEKVSERYQKGWGPPVVPVNLMQFCWLFEVLREANAAQVVVELLLKLDVSRVLLAAFDPYATTPSRPEIVYQWAKMMYLIFQDVLGGRLFLTTAERVALYQQWNWILKKVNNLRPEEPLVSRVVASFIMSFPQLQQEEIYLRWASNLDEYPLQADYNLSQVHTMWMMSLVSSEVPKLEEKLSVPQIEHNVDKIEYLPTGSWDIL